MRLSSLVLATTLALFTAGATKAGEVIARVSITTQTMVVSIDGESQYLWSVSTAGPPHVTPLGEYRPYMLHSYHWSRKYKTPMPFSVFYSGNFAVHATTDLEHLGMPASHGCVRLALENAHTFFNLVQANGMDHTTVIIQ